MSLINIGTPCKALRRVPFALSASRVAAIDNALGLISKTAFSTLEILRVSNFPIKEMEMIIGHNLDFKFLSNLWTFMAS